MSIAQVVLFAVLGTFIVFTVFVIIKNVIAPTKLGGIPRLIKDGKIAAATRTAKAVVAKNPRDYVAHYWLGEAYFADGKQELAFMEYKVVNENAVFDGQINELQFRKRMAELYSKNGESDNALKEYLLLTNMEPKNAENDFNVARIYESQGHGAQAIGFYQKALNTNPRHAKAHAALGYLLFRNKQYEKAKKEIDTAIKLSPGTYSSYYYLGKVLKESKDYSGAIKALEKAERDPEFRQRALIERGSCFMAVSQVDNAIGAFERAVKVARNEGSQETLFARYFLAACYENTRKLDLAIAQWEKIYQRNRGFRDVSAKLDEYRELQSNDSMKEYLTAAPEQFVEICKKTAAAGLSLAPKKIDSTSYGCKMLAIEQKNEKNWMSMRQQLFLVEFHRETNPVEDGVLRKLADEIKAQNCSKGVICASGGFSKSAVSYAEERPIVLIDKDKLEGILSKAGI